MLVCAKWTDLVPRNDLSLPRDVDFGENSDGWKSSPPRLALRNYFSWYRIFATSQVPENPHEWHHLSHWSHRGDHGNPVLSRSSLAKVELANDTWRDGG